MSSMHPLRLAAWGRGWRLGFLTTLLASLVLSVAAGSRAAHAALWIDDLFSLTTSEENASRIVALLRQYRLGYFDHPPLYFLFLHWHMALAGNAPLVLRAPSMLFFALSAGVGVAALRREGLPLALCAGWAIALLFHPVMLFQSTCVRMYTLVFLLSTAAVAGLLRISRSVSWRDATPPVLLLSATLASLVYTTYMGLLAGCGLGALAVLWLVRPALAEGGGRRSGAAVMVALGLAALAYAPWWPTVARMLRAEETGSPVEWPARLAEIRDRLIGVGGTLPGLAILVIGWIGVMLDGRLRASWFGALIAFLILPFVQLAFTSPANRALQDRYLVMGYPVALMGMALGWHCLSLRLCPRHRLAAAAAVAALLLPVPFRIREARATFLKPQPDWWGVARILEANARRDEIILTGLFLSGEALVYHMERPQDFQFLHYVNKWEDFQRACADPRVMWYVNAAPLPAEFVALVDRRFPHRVLLDGNGMLGAKILVAAKRPFVASMENPRQGPAASRQSPVQSAFPRGPNPRLADAPPLMGPCDEET